MYREVLAVFTLVLSMPYWVPERRSDHDEDCIRLCNECLELCRTCVLLLTSSSGLAHQVCGICSELCTACAAECGKYEGETMKKCARECRECAGTCAEVAQAGPVRPAAAWDVGMKLLQSHRVQNGPRLRSWRTWDSTAWGAASANFERIMNLSVPERRDPFG